MRTANVLVFEHPLPILISSLSFLAFLKLERAIVSDWLVERDANKALRRARRGKHFGSICPDAS